MITANIEAEKAILGAVLNGAPPPSLTVDAFTTPETQELWKCFEKGIITQKEIFATKNPEIHLTDLIFEIDALPPTTNLQMYVDAVQRAQDTRELKTTLLTSLEKLEQGQETKTILKELAPNIDRVQERGASLPSQVKEWLSVSQGSFYVKETYDLFGCYEQKSRRNLRKVFDRLANDGLLARDKAIQGRYRIIDNSIQPMNLEDIDEREININLPFNLHKLYVCRPNHIIVVAGEPNAGKTGFLLNTVKANMDGEYRDRIHYFNSEMGPGELKSRLREFTDRNPDTWNAHFYERADNFADVIKPNDINIIDFLELDGSDGREFWRAGKLISDIHEKLQDGICILAIQKNRGSPFGLGGQRGLEKARLYVTLSGLDWEQLEGERAKVHTATIEKLKEPRITSNVNGHHLHYLLGGGATISEKKHYDNTKHWHAPSEEEEKDRYDL